MDSEYDMYRYLHLRSLNAWTKRRDDLREREESERKTREAQFPSTISQFNAAPNDLQFRVARFLLADRAEKERMCDQFGWAYRQVKPLEEDFAKNVSVASDFNMWRVRSSGEKRAETWRDGVRRHRTVRVFRVGGADYMNYFSWCSRRKSRDACVKWK